MPTNFDINRYCNNVRQCTNAKQCHSQKKQLKQIMQELRKKCVMPSAPV